MAKETNISLPVIRRLPRYYRFLYDLKEKGITRISSRELSQKMRLTASQIRQDLNCFGGFGQQGYGYMVDQLYDEIGRILRDRRAGAVQGTDDLALRASALACEAPLAVLCRACDARALKEQAALNQFPAEELCFIPEACSPEQVAACGCERPEWPGDAPFEAAPALPADLAANAARWQKEFSRCVQCHWCRTACPVCVCPTCALDECAVLPAGMMPPSPLGYHLARAMHVADVCVQCGACQDVCPQGLPLLELHRAVARSLKARGYASGEGKASPMRAQRRLGDALGIAAPEWKSTGGKKA